VRKLSDEHRHCVGPGVRDVVRWGEVWAKEEHAQNRIGPSNRNVIHANVKPKYARPAVG